MYRYHGGIRLLYRAAVVSLLYAHLANFIYIFGNSNLSILSYCTLATAIQVHPLASVIHRNGSAIRKNAFVPSARTYQDGTFMPSFVKHRMNNVGRSITTYRIGKNIQLDRGSTLKLSLFGNIFGWFTNTFSGKWYVPPMPIGQRASTILKKHGPLQSDEETQQFFDLIGVHKDANLIEIGKAYENARDTLPEDMHKSLKTSFNEYLRKEFVEAFEHMESFMNQGPEAWEEYWDPSKDAFGNPVTNKFGSPEEEDEVMMSRLPKQLDATKFREYWRKNSSRFNTMMREVDMPSRVRLTRNFSGRLVQCTSTMLPIFVLGLFPQFTSLSVALQGLVASGFIFRGDRKVLLQREKKLAEVVPTAGPKAKSTSSKTLITSMLLCAHSILGLGTCKLLCEKTSILEYLTPQILRTACINVQLFIAALLYDTSDLTPLEYVKREEKRLDRITDTLGDIEE
ncbi:hypothetical protein BgAZ_105670 [Babesia gibsoni]|uniref:Uncharacterized protein n=1 Tax=Babesia gibsoni TaxID=33632 RepID=A0AAD8PG30_BABGI|nr:hypothetical protein BgAZ_105670 [Babesia gibsoni]